MKHISFDIIIMVILIINSVIIALSFFDISEDFTDLMLQLDSYFVYVYILEAVLKIIGIGIFDYFRDNWNKMDFILIIITMTTDVALNMFKFVKNAKTAKASKLVSSIKIKNALKASRSLKSVKMIRCCKKWLNCILKPFYRVRNLIHKIILCLNSIVQTVTMLIIIFHIYAVAGMILFDAERYDTQDDSPYTRSISSFESYAHALLQMLLVVTENGWSNVIYDIGFRFRSLWISSLFFNTFYSIVKFVILSLMVGLIWEIFLIISEHLESNKGGVKDVEKQSKEIDFEDEDSEESDESNVIYFNII